MGAIIFRRFWVSATWTLIWNPDDQTIRPDRYIDAGEQAPTVDRRSWPGASDQVIETINRVLGAAAERFDGLSVTNSKNYGAFQWRGIQNQDGLVLPSKGPVLSRRGADGPQASSQAASYWH